MGFRERHAIPDLGRRRRLPEPPRRQSAARAAGDGLVRDHQRELLRRGRHPRAQPRGGLRTATASCRTASRSRSADRAARPDYLRRLRDLVRRLDAPWCSDHLCWTGASAASTCTTSCPCPITRATLEHVVERVKRVQGELGVPFALENASSYLEFRESTMPEPEFLAELAERADCGLLLDVNNVYVSAYNHGFDAARVHRRDPRRPRRADPRRRAHGQGHVPPRHARRTTFERGVGALSPRRPPMRRRRRRSSSGTRTSRRGRCSRRRRSGARRARRGARRRPERAMGERDLATLQRFSTRALRAGASARGDDASRARALVAQRRRRLDPPSGSRCTASSSGSVTSRTSSEDFPTLAWAVGAAAFQRARDRVPRGIRRARGTCSGSGPNAPRLRPGRAALGERRARPGRRAARLGVHGGLRRRRRRAARSAVLA